MKVVWLLEALRGRNNKVDLNMVLTVDSILHSVSCQHIQVQEP